MRTSPTGTSQRYEPGSPPSRPGPQRLLTIGRISRVARPRAITVGNELQCPGLVGQAFTTWRGFRGSRLRPPHPDHSGARNPQRRAGRLTARVSRSTWRTAGHNARRRHPESDATAGTGCWPTPLSGARRTLARYSTVPIPRRCYSELGTTQHHWPERMHRCCEQRSQDAHEAGAIRLPCSNWSPRQSRWSAWPTPVRLRGCRHCDPGATVIPAALRRTSLGERAGSWHPSPGPRGPSVYPASPDSPEADTWIIHSRRRASGSGCCSGGP